MSQVASSQKLSRDDWRKKKELEEARKAGTAPAEVDEEGKDINPHIPQYIAQAPWYVTLGRPSLKHQRPQEEKQKRFSNISEWYKRGKELQSQQAAKYRKGACENCGSMTHKKKDCLERPRKVGAKYTSEDIQPDEVIQPNLDFDYDAKRDRWNGYNPDEHQDIIEEYSKVELARRQLRADQLQKELVSGTLSEETVRKVMEDGNNSDEDEEKYADQADMPGTKFDSKTRTTVRNLRIREDTAKYLYNLDPNSAYYDPKTRSMRENPFKNSNKDPSELKYAGENLNRHTGDVKKFAQAQMFAWEAYEHGTSIHSLADPTKLELMHKDFKTNKSSFKSELQQDILDRYGGEEHLDAPPKELLLAQTEEYVEYSRLGNVVKGQEKAIARSKYEEDVYINNHTSVWGSYWTAGQWGYACCYSLIKRSYCSGESGKIARRTISMLSTDVSTSSSSAVASSSSTSRERETTAAASGGGGAGMAEGESDEEEDRPQSLLDQHKAKLSKMTKVQLREERRKKEALEATRKEHALKKALEAEDTRDREVDRLMAIDERKRPYHSLKADNSKVPTEEEMEAYRLKKRRTDDPMADFL